MMAINPLHVVHNTQCTTVIPCVFFPILLSCLSLLFKILPTICHLFTFLFLWVISDDIRGSNTVLFDMHKNEKLQILSFDLNK
jgi:hypothetical protein